MRVLSYNIHKGFTPANLEFVLSEMKLSIEQSAADLVFLQEVVGEHAGHAEAIEGWPVASQFEFLADKLWPHFAYGKNAVYTEGHHGNAILSKYPIRFHENQNISTNDFERRGVLHAVLEGPSGPLHALCTHLSLFASHRSKQLETLTLRVKRTIPEGEPLILAGDFNDWRESASPVLRNALGLDEVFLRAHKRHARTFPAWFPLLRLDRMYYRGLTCRSAELASGSVWRSLSDHLPILAEFQD